MALLHSRASKLSFEGQKEKFEMTDSLVKSLAHAAICSSGPLVSDYTIIHRVDDVEEGEK